MNLVKQLILANRLSFSVLVVTSIVSGGLNAVFLALVTYSLARPEIQSVQTVSIFVGACLGILMIKVLHRYISVDVSNKTSNQLRIRLSQLVATSSTASLEKHGIAKLLTVLTADVGTVTDFILNIPAKLGNAAFLLGAMIYLAYLSGIGLFAGMLGITMLLMVVYSKVMAASKAHFQRVRQEAEIMMGYQTDLVNGYKEIKMDAGIGRRLIEDCMRPSNQRLADALFKAGMRHGFGLIFGAALIYLFVGIVLFTFPVMLNYSTEVVMGYVIAIMAAANPLQSVLEIYPMFARARVSAEKIAALQEELEHIQEHIGSASAPVQPLSFSKIDLSGVTFSYNEHDGGETRLGPFDLTVCSGEVLFLSGGNGSGKTTLSKLICGLYVPKSGTLTLDGQVIAESKLSLYRQHFSTVFSDFHVLKNSPQIYDLTRLAKHSLAGGFGLDESQYLRGGVISSDELSQGQRRRLAILMAINIDKPIYLFDEPGSDLDPDFKRFFYGTVLSHLKEKRATVIVVTHDDNYFQYADRLLGLRDGRIVSGNASLKDLPGVVQSSQVAGA
ncbi:MAG TPA: cyclic peptide export ABC transporter [Gammaproteobacteria bacterium]|jgi:putative ATP-binding cassette transporter